MDFDKYLITVLWLLYRVEQEIEEETEYEESNEEEYEYEELEDESESEADETDNESEEDDYIEEVEDVEDFLSEENEDENIETEEEEYLEENDTDDEDLTGEIAEEETTEQEYEEEDEEEPYVLDEDTEGEEIMDDEEYTDNEDASEDEDQGTEEFEVEEEAEEIEAELDEELDYSGGYEEELETGDEELEKIELSEEQEIKDGENSIQTDENSDDDQSENSDIKNDQHPTEDVTEGTGVEQKSPKELEEAKDEFLQSSEDNAQNEKGKEPAKSFDKKENLSDKKIEREEPFHSKKDSTNIIPETIESANADVLSGSDEAKNNKELFTKDVDETEISPEQVAEPIQEEDILGKNLKYERGQQEYINTIKRKDELGEKTQLDDNTIMKKNEDIDSSDNIQSIDGMHNFDVLEATKVETFTEEVVINAMNTFNKEKDSKNIEKTSTDGDGLSHKIVLPVQKQEIDLGNMFPLEEKEEETLQTVEDNTDEDKSDSSGSLSEKSDKAGDPLQNKDDKHESEKNTEIETQDKSATYKKSGTASKTKAKQKTKVAKKVKETKAKNAQSVKQAKRTNQKSKASAKEKLKGKTTLNEASLKADKKQAKSKVGTPKQKVKKNLAKSYDNETKTREIDAKPKNPKVIPPQEKRSANAGKNEDISANIDDIGTVKSTQQDNTEESSEDNKEYIKKEYNNNGDSGKEAGKKENSIKDDINKEHSNTEDSKIEGSNDAEGSKKEDTVERSQKDSTIVSEDEKRSEDKKEKELLSVLGNDFENELKVKTVTSEDTFPMATETADNAEVVGIQSEADSLPLYTSGDDKNIDSIYGDAPKQEMDGNIIHEHNLGPGVDESFDYLNGLLSRKTDSKTSSEDIDDGLPETNTVDKQKHDIFGDEIFADILNGKGHSQDEKTEKYMEEDSCESKSPFLIHQENHDDDSCSTNSKDNNLQQKYDEDLSKIMQMVNDKKGEHEAKLQSLEMQLLRIENQILSDNLNSSNKAASLSKLENIILKLENEILRLNQSFHKVKAENEKLKQNQQTQANDIALVKQSHQTPYALDTDIISEINDAMTKQHTRLKELISSVKTQESFINRLDERSVQMERRNHELQMQLMNQSLLTSQLMARIEGLVAKQEQQRVSIEKLQQSVVHGSAGYKEREVDKKAKHVEKAENTPSSNANMVKKEEKVSGTAETILQEEILKDDDQKGNTQESTKATNKESDQNNVKTVQDEKQQAVDVWPPEPLYADDSYNLPRGMQINLHLSKINRKLN